MRIAAFADIHGNADALGAVLELIGALDVDRIYCLGASVGGGPSPDEVLKMLDRPDIIRLRGRWDHWVAQNAPVTPKQQLWVEHNRARMRSMEGLCPDRSHVELEVLGHRIVFAHGVPADPFGAWTACTPPARLDTSNSDLIVVGHAHHPFVRRVHDGLIVNCGSVGLPNLGDPRACLALINVGEDIDVELVRVPYRVRRTSQLSLQKEPPVAEGPVRFLRSLLGNGPEPRCALEASTCGCDLLIGLLSSRTQNVYRRATKTWPVNDRRRIHKVRIGTRRLRAALEVAEPVCRKKQWQRVHDAVRGLTSAFGRRRSMDALEERLEALPSGTTKEQDVLRRAHALVAIRRRRTSAWLKSTYPRGRLLGDGLDVVDLMMRPADALRPMYELMIRNLRRRLKAVDRLRNTIDTPDDAHGQHELRTSLKRLRYSLEIASEVMPELWTPRDMVRLRRGQDTLGALHDERELELFLSHRRMRYDVEPAALDAVVQRIRDRQRPLYVEALAAIRGPVDESLRILRTRLD